MLVGDRLVGKVDTEADHEGRMLRVYAVHEDAPFSGEQRDAVRAEIADLARWSGLEVAWE